MNHYEDSYYVSEAKRQGMSVDKYFGSLIERINKEHHEHVENLKHELRIYKESDKKNSYNGYIIFLLIILVVGLLIKR